jgi:hypothetical protein
MNRQSPWTALPEPVVALIESAIVAEFATVSAQGVPIDTPTFAFASGDVSHIAIATGLAYPVKAERARRNPHVGLLVEGLPGEPVVSIAAMAAVRDASIQENADRYIAETIGYYDSYANGNPWSVGRQAVQYWSRVFVECTPARIWWWPNAAAMDAAPQQWHSAPGTAFPGSDPAPAGPATKAPAWPAQQWRERAQAMLAAGVGAHLTCLEDQGFPMPIRARGVTLVEDGFELELPRGLPWSVQGVATLTFLGASTFVGRAVGTRFVVERILPTLPMVQDQNEIWNPSDQTRAALIGRLQQELSRRGQAIPVIPEQAPPPTAGSLRRAARMSQLGAAMSAARQE